MLSTITKSTKEHLFTQNHRKFHFYFTLKTMQAKFQLKRETAHTQQLTSAPALGFSRRGFDI